MNCGTLEVYELYRTLCGDCLDGGFRFCVYCAGTWQFSGERTPCVAGHDHEWCDGCAVRWANVCPDSDEARVVKAVMG